MRSILPETIIDPGRESKSHRPALCGATVQDGLNVAPKGLETQRREGRKARKEIFTHP